MQIRNRYFNSDSMEKLCAFYLDEGEIWARPVGSKIIHCEPLIDDGYLTGVCILALVPQSSILEDVEGG